MPVSYQPRVSFLPNQKVEPPRHRDSEKNMYYSRTGHTLSANDLCPSASPVLSGSPTCGGARFRASHLCPPETTGDCQQKCQHLGGFRTGATGGGPLGRSPSP